MDDRRAGRLVRAALRCYPARWRHRHGHEAAELAALLIRDGTPAASIACSYLAGAAREWMTPRPGRRLSRVACALLVGACSLSVSVGLLAQTAPATAASTSRVHRHMSCRPGWPQPVPALDPAVGRAPVITWRAGHGRSC